MVLASQDPDILCRYKTLKRSIFVTAVRLLRSSILAKYWPESLFPAPEPGMSQKVYFRPVDPIQQVIQFSDVEVGFKDLIDIVHNELAKGGWGMSLLPLVVAAVTSRATGLARMRDAGKNASLSKNLQRTSYMRATYP
jgi:hypothetical protein